MNAKQLVALWLGIAAIVALCLVPPLQYYRQGVRWLGSAQNYRINWPVLGLEVGIVTLVTAGLVVTMKDRTRRP